MRGWECAWLAPQHKTWSETFTELVDLLRPILKDRSKGSGVLRLTTGGRLDFWTLENAIAGRGRRYRRVVIDEAAFAKDGDTKADGSMMEIWEKSIKPTLFDYGGEALACSNSAGKNPDNFFYNICTDPQYGFTGIPRDDNGQSDASRSAHSVRALKIGERAASNSSLL